MVSYRGMVKKNWYLYIVETDNGTLYTGITTDIERRFTEHSAQKKGAKFFRISSPKAIKYTKGRLTHSQALKLECKIKAMTREAKLAFIEKSKKARKPTVKQK